MKRAFKVLLVLFLALIFFTGCVNYQEIRRQTDILNTGTPDQKRAAAKSLVLMGSPSVPKLVSIINNSENKLTVDLAIEAIGDIRDAAGVNALTGIIIDDRYLHFPAVKKALVKLPAGTAVPKLCGILPSLSGRRTLCAIDILGDFKDSVACPSLVPLLEKKDPAVIKATGDALVKLSPDSIAPLAAVLNDYNDVYRRNAENVLIKIGPPVYDAMLGKLSSSEKNDRESAARVLGGINEPKAIGPLIEMFEDHTIAVRRAAAKAVAQYKNAALPQLTACVQDNLDNPLVLKQAAYALGLIGSAGAAAELSKMLGSNDPLVKEATARAMGYGAGSHTFNILKKALRDSDWRVRKAAAESMRTLKWKPADDNEKAFFMVADQDWAGLIALGNAALPPLKLSLKDHAGWVRRSAVETIAAIKKPDEEALLKMLSDPNPRLRASAAQTLGRLCSAKAESKLINLLSDQDNSVKMAAINSLAVLRSAKAVPKLRTMLQTPDSGLRCAVVDALWCSGDESVVDDLAVLAEKDIWEVRRKAIIGLSVYPSKKSDAALVAALDDPDFQNRKTAAAALKKRSWKPANNYQKCLYNIADNNWDAIVSMGADARPALLLFVKNDNHLVRILAVGMLGQCGGEQDLPVMIQALNNDKEPNVREAAGFAIYRIGGAAGIAALTETCNKSDVPLVRRICCENIGKFKAVDQPAVAAVIAALADKNPGVRLAAATSLGRLKSVAAVNQLALMAKTDRDSRVRRAAARALRRIGGNKAMAELNWMRMHSKDQDVRREAIRAFSK